MFRFVLILLCVFWFKSCSGAAGRRAMYLNSGNSSGLPEAEQKGDDSGEKEVPEVVEEKAPEPDDPEEFNYFPYDLQLDTLAFLSCETDHFFTFQGGAWFSLSGIRLSEYFLRKKESMSAGALETLIKSSTKYGAFPYLSVSNKNQLRRGILTPKGIFNSHLRLHDLIPELVKSGKTRIREYNGDPIKAEIKQKAYVSEYSYRDGFKKELVLALYYIGGKNNAMLHWGPRDGQDIYGRTYSLDLEDLDIVSAGDDDDRYALVGVSEKKLLPSAPDQKEWTCPDSLRLEIRRHERNTFKPEEWYNYQLRNWLNYNQWYDTFAKAQNANDHSHRPPPPEPTCEDSSGGGAALSVARKVLGDDWNINIGEKCISPRNSRKACYTISTPPINDVTDRLERDKAHCNNNKNKYCPQFLSVCVRKN